MEVNGGMMAVVRGLQDSALCVTLLDGARQYTLLPNSAVPTVSQPVRYTKPTQKTQMVHSGDQDRLDKGRCESSSQAVDGRYASIYKMTHCNMAPTSPPVELTEFPPQKAELCPGQGNFEVGGQGSGENYHPRKVQNSFRGGMSWSDTASMVTGRMNVLGSVCSPRGGHSPDPFASSLRKYPSMSPERSVELVERLVNYSQMKNSRTMKTSPTRSDSSTQNQEKVSHCSRRSESEPYRCCLHDDYTARERRKIEECRVYGRNHDVRFSREVSKRIRDSTRNATYPYSHPVCPTINERFDHLPELLTTKSVNMETQAEIPMVSREVTTVPRVQPSVRNVAIPFSPSSSNSDSKPESRNHNSKSVQTSEALDLLLKIRKSVQTCFSSIDLQESKKVKNKKKSKSQEELRVNDDVDEEILKLIQNLTSSPDLERENAIRGKLLKKLRKLQKIDSEPVKIKIGRCIKERLYSEIDLKNFTRELSNELISKIKRHHILIANNPTNVFRANTFLYKVNQEEKFVDAVITEWLNDIPIQNLDYFGREIKKGQLSQSILNKIKTLIINKPKNNSDSTMKADLIEIIEDMPIDVSGHNRRFYINRLVSELMRKIKDIFTSNHGRRFRNLEYPRQYFRLTEKEIKLFVRQEINEFTSKFGLKICQETLKQMETGLTSVLMDSIDVIRLGVNLDDVKEDVLVTLADFVSISEQQAIYFANNMIYNLKDIFDRNFVSKPRPQTFVVLHNSLQSGTNNTENSIVGITQADIDNNLDFYTNQIIQQITEWSNNIKRFEDIEAGFKQVVITDLAGDIVDRHKYLELNPSSKKTDSDELEHLKYQIFKWINKVTGDYNMETIDRAAELMERIQRLPVPMLIMPQQNSKPIPSCCQNANLTVPNIKPEDIQSTSKGRRYSSPDNYKQKPESIELMKTVDLTGDQNKQQSRQDAATGDDDCCRPHDETTESKFNTSIPITSTPKNMPNTDVGTVQNRMRNSPGPSVSMIEQPNRTPQANRRMSVPAGFSSIGKRTSTESSSGYGSQRKSGKNSCCINDRSKPVLLNESPPIKRLNDDYDAFVKDWVQKIPIDTTSPEEKALAEKARLGIYNGIWKAITKLKMNPATMNNPFYYQDVFDDEIEELLNFLPQTPDLVNKKHAMKAQLIEKTTGMNEMLVSAVEPSTYKQQLVENVSNNLPKSKIDNTVRDEVKQFEELLKMNLVDNFILYTKFKAYDKVKANVFKKKVMKEVHELINSVKANHGKELKDIDPAAYVTEVINALQKVPLPSEDTIREEADEINIGLEIDQWFSDLPLLPSENKIEDMERRRHKDTLAKKLHDIERESPLDEWENRIKEEIRRFLRRISLKPEQTDNINFMVEELINRMRNRPTDIIALGKDRKKSVTFVDAYDYNDFSRDMPACSSFSDMGRPTQADQSSYMIVDGTRVKDPYTQYNQDSEPQWFTLEKSNDIKSPDGINTPSCCQTQAQTSQPHQSNQTASSQTPNSLIIRESPQNSRTEILSEYQRLKSQSSQNSQSDLNPLIDQGTQYLESPDGQYTEGYNRLRTCTASGKSKRTSAPPSYRTEEPISTQTRDFTPNQKSHSPKTTIPLQFCNPGNSSVPRRRSREERMNERRLHLDDTEYDSEEEFRCRCIEKMWRCRKKSYYPCHDDYSPCYLRYPPRHCYF